MRSTLKVLLAAGVAIGIATAVVAAVSHNSSRSNFTRKITVNGKIITVKQSYNFDWSVDSKGQKLGKEEMRALLEIVFREIRKDVLR